MHNSQNILKEYKAIELNPFSILTRLKNFLRKSINVSITFLKVIILEKTSSYLSFEVVALIN